MLAKISGRLTYANVMATIAVFMALATGGAYAAQQITSADIVDGQVKSVDIGDKEVRTPDIGGSAVRSRHIATDAVLTQHIVNEAVSSEKIAQNAITSDHLLNDSVTSDDIRQGDIQSIDIGDGQVIGIDIVNDAIHNRHVIDGTLTSNDIQSTSVLGEDIANDAIGERQLAPRAITPTDFGTIPAARVQKTSPQTVSHNTATNLSFDAESFDTAALHDNATNNSRLTAPIPGLYQVSAGIRWASNLPGGSRELRLQVNGSGILAAQDTIPAAPTNPGQSASTLVSLPAGSFMEATVFQNSGSSIEAQLTHLAMHWVGPLQ